MNLDSRPRFVDHFYRRNKREKIKRKGKGKRKEERDHIGDVKFQLPALFREIAFFEIIEADIDIATRTQNARGSRFSIFYIFFLYIYSRCPYRTRKKLWEVVGGKISYKRGRKNVVVNVDGGFQYSGNYVVTAGVFLGYLPNEDFSVESKKII